MSANGELVDHRSHAAFRTLTGQFATQVGQSSDLETLVGIIVAGVSSELKRGWLVEANRSLTTADPSVYFGSSKEAVAFLRLSTSYICDFLDFFASQSDKRVVERLCGSEKKRICLSKGDIAAGDDAPYFLVDHA